MAGTKAEEGQNIMDGYGVLLRDKGEIRDHWVWFFCTLLNVKLPNLDHTIR